jgi:hypothetical protein
MSLRSRFCFCVCFVTALLAICVTFSSVLYHMCNLFDGISESIHCKFCFVIRNVTCVAIYRLFTTTAFWDFGYKTMAHFKDKLLFASARKNNANTYVRNQKQTTTFSSQQRSTYFENIIIKPNVFWTTENRCRMQCYKLRKKALTSNPNG